METRPGIGAIFVRIPFWHITRGKPGNPVIPFILIQPVVHILVWLRYHYGIHSPTQVSREQRERTDANSAGDYYYCGLQKGTYLSTISPVNPFQDFGNHNG